MQKLCRYALLSVGFSLGLALASPAPVQAVDRDVRAVLVAGGYGLLGGTALGLASWPLTRDSRSIFIGTSVGLYLGIVVGIYYVLDRENPDNPLRTESLPSNSLEWAAFRPPAGTPPPLVEIQLPVARF